MSSKLKKQKVLEFQKKIAEMLKRVQYLNTKLVAQQKELKKILKKRVIKKNKKTKK